MKAFHCKVNYDNGATIEEVHMLVFTDREENVPYYCDSRLCKHNDESITIEFINELPVSDGSTFVLDKYK